DAVRVMTVHGSKGLQAPVVILADACVDPARSRGGSAKLRLGDQGPVVPIFRPRSDELCEPLKSQLEAQDLLDRQEHWRLLYVGMTRAEERLFIGGSLGPADRNGPPPTSWYATAERALDGLGCEWTDHPIWGRSRLFGGGEVAARPQAAVQTARSSVLPEWLGRPAPPESRPPRPLAPSAIGEDDVANPPPGPEMRAAAERGRLLHQLFERLPDVPPEERSDRADSWLRHSAGVEDENLRRSLVADACRIIADPDYSDIFTPEALAEAPIAAVTPDGSVITGTVDRLLVADRAVRLVDFKTGRAVPASPVDIPVSHLRQMAAYHAALEVIFPDRRIEAALLYTAGPVLHPLPRELLLPHMPHPIRAGA
ncbi:MAG: PD-(D/E)XK nuclease family protein, partial [Pseudomonadota bacterium]|nr:PD-(D/E)XK nuclease family protein [Pseudomonadota bacterium]